MGQNDAGQSFLIGTDLRNDRGGLAVFAVQSGGRILHIDVFPKGFVADGGFLLCFAGGALPNGQLFLFIRLLGVFRFCNLEQFLCRNRRCILRDGIFLRQELFQQQIQLILRRQILRGGLVFVHRWSSCQRMTNWVATSSATSWPFSAATSARPKGTAQPAEVPVISLPSTTKALFSSMRALPISPSQPG